jgi:hypothetical protein
MPGTIGGGMDDGTICELDIIDGGGPDCRGRASLDGRAIGGGPLTCNRKTRSDWVKTTKMFQK